MRGKELIKSATIALTLAICIGILPVQASKGCQWDLKEKTKWGASVYAEVRGCWDTQDSYGGFYKTIHQGVRFCPGNTEPEGFIYIQAVNTERVNYTWIPGDTVDDDTVDFTWYADEHGATIALTKTKSGFTNATGYFELETVWAAVWNFSG